MFLFEPERTQFDLQWRMFGIPVRVHPMFWLVGVLMGWNLTRDPHGNGLLLLLLWIACVFVSILVHELGHVFMGQWFGSYGHIVLFGFGGLAIGSANLPNRWQRIAVSFAGPLAQFLLYGIIELIYWQADLKMFPLWVLIGLGFLKWINLTWPLLNLLPIWPLDGGQISRDFLGWLAPRRGMQLSLGISIICAGLLAINAIMVEQERPLLPFFNWGGTYPALFFGLLAFGSFQALQQHEANMKRWRRDPWE